MNKNTKYTTFLMKTTGVAHLTDYKVDEQTFGTNQVISFFASSPLPSPIELQNMKNNINIVIFCKF